MMAAGKDSFVVVTWPGSVLALARHQMGDGVRRSIYPETGTVPRNSMALVRSDLVHAGASAADDAARYGKAPAELNYSRSIRFHMYQQHKKDKLQDAIRLVDPKVFISSALIILDDDEVYILSDNDNDGRDDEEVLVGGGPKAGNKNPTAGTPGRGRKDGDGGSTSESSSGRSKGSGGEPSRDSSGNGLSRSRSATSSGRSSDGIDVSSASS